MLIESGKNYFVVESPEAVSSIFTSNSFPEVSHKQISIYLFIYFTKQVLTELCPRGLLP